MSKLLKIFMLMAVVLVVVPTLSHAGSGRNFGQIYTECGIGAMVFQHQKWAGLAAISNILWDFGTTAISSELTTPDSCMGGKAELMAAFIYQSYDALENDLAKGSGKHLDTLVALSGKTGDVQFIETLRGGLASLVADSTYTAKTQFEKSESLYNLVNAQMVNVS